MNLINLTPHAIVIAPSGDVGAPDTITVQPSGTVARLVPTQNLVRHIFGAPVHLTRFQDVVNLPDPAPQTVYLVSILVQLHLGHTRPDVMGPDTNDGRVIRNDRGQIVAVTGLQVMG